MQIYNLTKSTHFFWSGRNVFEAEWTRLFRQLSCQLPQELLHLQNIWNRKKEKFEVKAVHRR